MKDVSSDMTRRYLSPRFRHMCFAHETIRLRHCVEVNNASRGFMTEERKEIKDKDAIYDISDRTAD